MYAIQSWCDELHQDTDDEREIDDDTRTLGKSPHLEHETPHRDDESGECNSKKHPRIDMEIDREQEREPKYLCPYLDMEESLEYEPYPEEYSISSECLPRCE
jgi:hypothetical protein